MALIPCPECLKEISDKARSCPNCGIPITSVERYRANEILRERDPDYAEKEEKRKLENKKAMKNYAILGVVIVVVLGVLSIMDTLDSRPAKLPPIPQSNAEPSSSKSNVSSGGYKDKQIAFASDIKMALNAPGLPVMCERAYFNDLGELIIEVNGEWIILDDGIKQDMIYALKELLKKRKEDLGVEGYGQFFSTSGKGLEAFYAD